MQFTFEKPRRTAVHNHTPAEQLRITGDTPVWVAVPETNFHQFHVGEELRLFEDNGTDEPFFRSVEREFEQWYVPLSDLSFEALTPADFGWSVGDFGEDSEGTLVQLVSSNKPEYLKFKDGLIVNKLRTELDVRKLKRFPKLPRVFQIKVTCREHAELRQHECIEYVQGAWIAGNAFHEFSPSFWDRPYYLCFDGTVWHWNNTPSYDEGSVTITLEQFTQWLEHRHRIVTLDKQAPVRPVAPEPAPKPTPECQSPAQARGISVGTTVWFTRNGHHRLQYGDELVLSLDDGTSFPFFTCTNRGPAGFEHCVHLGDVSLIDPNKDETPLQQAGLEVGSVCILKEDYENDMGELVLRKHSAVAVVQDDGSERPYCHILQPAHGLFGAGIVFPYVHLLQDTGLKHDVESI